MTKTRRKSDYATFAFTKKTTQKCVKKFENEQSEVISFLQKEIKEIEKEIEYNRNAFQKLSQEDNVTSSRIVKAKLDREKSNILKSIEDKKIDIGLKHDQNEIKKRIIQKLINDLLSLKNEKEMISSQVEEAQLSVSMQKGSIKKKEFLLEQLKKLKVTIAEFVGLLEIRQIKKQTRTGSRNSRIGEII